MKLLAVIITLSCVLLPSAHAAQSKASAVKSQCVLVLNKLKSNDSLLNVAEEIASEWADNNITTGTTELFARSIENAPANEKELKDLSVEVFKRLFKNHLDVEVPADVKLTTKVYQFDAKFENRVAYTLGVSNAYDPKYKTGTEEFKENYRTLVKALGNEADLVAVETRAKAINDGDEEYRKLYSYTIMNVKTKKAVLIFLIEGTM